MTPLLSAEDVAAELGEAHPRIAKLFPHPRGHRRAHGGGVYFLQADCPSRLIKIGTTLTLVRRLQVLQRYSPVRLRLIGACRGGRVRERVLHERFAHLRRHAEWFAPGADLLAFIEGLSR